MKWKIRKKKKNIREFLLQVYYWLISIKLKWGGSTHGCRLTAVNTLKTNKFGNTHNPRLKEGQQASKQKAGDQQPFASLWKNHINQLPE